MSRRYLADKLVKSRFRSKKELRRLIDEYEKDRYSQPLPRFLKGVHNGVFFRIKVPPKKPILPDIPRLPSTPQSTPLRQFKSVEHHGAYTSPLAAQTPRQKFQESATRLREWFAMNWSVLLFNFGSVCTLVGFTRSDVLELRVFSVTGSMGGVVYNLVQKPLRWPPVLWGLTFASVNAWKIFEIVQERRATVHLTAQEEDIYVTHFLQHGVTPKQFEAISKRAKMIQLKKDEILIRPGEKQQYIYLVVEGSTEASILGRHLTAVSTTPTAHENKGGASGAWIGEMAFLEAYWIKEQGKHITADEKGQKDTKSKKGPVQTEKCLVKSKTQSKDSPGAEGSLTKPARKAVKPRNDLSVASKMGESLYTIVAKEDCKLMRWSHDDMEELMERSTDLRSAMTRAMAAAVVGKVINFTVSRANASAWSRWLGDWKSVDGTRVLVAEDDAEESSPHDEERQETLDEMLPAYPVKKFK